MKLYIFLALLLSQPVWGHHTSGHTMLMQDAEQVIAETQQGADDSSASFLWLGVVLLLGIGVMNLFNKK